MGNLAIFISDFFLKYIIKFCNVLIDIAQAGYNGLIAFVISIVALFPAGTPLPAAPTTPTGAIVGKVLDCINWVLPMGYMVSMVAWLLLGMTAYIIIAPLARWAKLLT